MGRSHRPERLAEEIKKIIGSMLLTGKLKDPRFQGMIAVSGADVSRDGSYATVYVTAMGYDPSMDLSDSEKQGILDASLAKTSRYATFPSSYSSSTSPSNTARRWTRCWTALTSSPPKTRRRTKRISRISTGNARLFRDN